MYWDCIVTLTGTNYNILWALENLGHKMNKLPNKNQSAFLQNNTNIHYVHSQHFSRLDEQTHAAISRGLPEPTKLKNTVSQRHGNSPGITKHSKILNVKLKAWAENFLFKCQNEFWKGRSYINPLFSMKLIIEKRREFNLESHFAFLDYVKAFDRVKRDKFEILQSKHIPNVLLKSTI